MRFHQLFVEKNFSEQCLRSFFVRYALLERHCSYGRAKTGKADGFDA